MQACLWLLTLNIWSIVPTSGLPGTRETQNYCWESSTGPLRWWEDWSIPHMRVCWESSDCSAWRSKSSGRSVSMNTWREGTKKMEPRSFQSYPVTGPEAKGTGSYTADALWASWITVKVIVHCHGLPREFLDFATWSMLNRHL